MKKLGVIGGLGPMATAYFFELVIQMTDAKVDQEHIEIWIHNCPTIPDRTSYILDPTRENPIYPILSSGKELCRMGAELIAIPCITAHYFYQELTHNIPVPIVHMVEETISYLRGYGKRRIGIMATDGTISSGLFQRELERNQMDWILPEKERQQEVMDLIYRDIKAGRSADMDKFYRVADELQKKGAETIILGCTELSLIKRDHVLYGEYIDTMEVLAKRSVELCGALLKESYQCLIT